MKRYSVLAFIAFMAASRGAAACYDTIITYEISRECVVRILHVHDENRDPIPSSEWDAAVKRWTEYLQSTATTQFDREHGVPPSARKIHRGHDHSLYCEFDERGAVAVAYILPAFWVEGKREWVVTGRELIPVFAGKLIDYMLYESTITTCH
jgi:hypothetical protein